MSCGDGCIYCGADGCHCVPGPGPNMRTVVGHNLGARATFGVCADCGAPICDPLGHLQMPDEPRRCIDCGVRAVTEAVEARDARTRCAVTRGGARCTKPHHSDGVHTDGVVTWRDGEELPERSGVSPMAAEPGEPAHVKGRREAEARQAANEAKARASLDLDKIEAAAREAQPGPWWFIPIGDDEFGGGCVMSDYVGITDGAKGGEVTWPNGKFIAAVEPNVALALVAEARALRVRCAFLASLAERAACGCVFADCGLHGAFHYEQHELLAAEALAANDRHALRAWLEARS